MPNKRIDQLPPSTNGVQGTDKIPVFSDNRTERYTIDEIASYIDLNNDTFVTGGTYSNGTVTLGRNDGVDLTISGLSTGSTNDYVISGNCVTNSVSDIQTTFGGVSVNTNLIASNLDFNSGTYVPVGGVFNTYQLTVDLVDPDYTNLYSIYGTSGCPMTLPAAFQVTTFGSDYGGVNPAFFPIEAVAQYDSWLAIGSTDGSQTGALGSIGIDYNSWGLDVGQSGITTNNGSLFWLDPNDGPSGTGIVVGQITVPTGTTFTVSMGLQGRRTSGTWSEECVTFTNATPNISEIKELSLARLSGDVVTVPLTSLYSGASFVGNTSVENLKISNVGSGTSVTNLGIDSSGNVVSGTTGGSSYGTYVALLTQTGTSAPVATVLENTLGINPTYARNAVGVYTLTSVGSFPANKTIVNFPRGYWNLFGGSILTEQRMAVYRDSSFDGEDVIYFYTAVDDTATDGIMTLNYGDNWWIEIRVYE